MTPGHRIVSELAGLVFAAALLGTAAAFLHPRKPVLAFEPPQTAPRLSMADLAGFTGADDGALPGLIVVTTGRDLPFPAELRRFPRAEMSPETFEENLGHLLNLSERAAPGSVVCVVCREGAEPAAEAVAKRLRDEAGFDSVVLLPLPRQGEKE